MAAVDVLPELENADLVKIDIEGAEWALLADPRFAGARPSVLVLEYHRDGSPHPNEAQAAEDALLSAGLEVVHGRRKPSSAQVSSGA